MENKAVAFIRKNDWCSMMVNHGTHNGYVGVPPGNKYHGMSYFDIKDIDVHGDITFSEPAINGRHTFVSKREYKPSSIGCRNPVLLDAEFITENTEIGDDWWIFGFDTFHYGDNPYTWNREKVIQETLCLMEQLTKQ